ncbi:MAG TPA: O-antigen ligase family protein [Verrucomicrobiae bacterium]
MNRKLAEQWCERGILFLTLAILVFGPLATGAVGMLEFTVIQALTVGVLVLWVARVWLDRRLELLWPPICWAVVAFALYAVARYWTADIEYVARQELLRVLVYTFLFFAILNNLHGQESIRIITFVMIGLAMLISFYALYQFITGSDRVWHYINPYKHRAAGTYINPNHLAGFLEMILPVSLVWTFASRAKPVGKVILGYASLVLMAGIVVTMSRAGWMAAGISLAVLFVVLALRSNYRWQALALIVVMVGLGAYFLPKSPLLKKRWDMVAKELTESHTADVRPAVWRAAIQLWKENLWWGAGPGHFDYRFRAFRPPVVQERPDRVHNDYLNTLADWGVVGTLLVAAAWGLLFAGVAQTWHYVRGSLGELGGRSSNKFAFVFGASLGLLAILVHSVADFNMHIPANAILAVTWMALLSAHLRFATERYWFSARVATRTVATVVLLGGIAYLGDQGWRRASEYVWLRQASRQSPYSPAQVEALQKAFAVEPRNFETAYRIGEALRIQSFEGGENYRAQATNAMSWFKQAMTLNRYDPYSPLRYGMCLDWLGQKEQSQAYFDRAVELDPNGYFTLAHVGWHYFQLGNYAAAKPWFQRSRTLMWKTNVIADSYLQIIQTKMLEAATNTALDRLQPLPQ